MLFRGTDQGFQQGSAAHGKWQVVKVRAFAAGKLADLLEICKRGLCKAEILQ